jgi:hypothetical protein
MSDALATNISMLEGALGDVREAITNAETPKARAQRAKVETYERVLRGWGDRKPTDEQFSSLLDCVMELHEEVLGRKEGGRGATQNRESAAPEEPCAVSSRPTNPVPDRPIPDDARRSRPSVPPQSEPKGGQGR